MSVDTYSEDYKLDCLARHMVLRMDAARAKKMLESFREKRSDEWYKNFLVKLNHQRKLLKQKQQEFYQ